MLLSEYDNLIRWNGRERPFYEVYYLKLNEPSNGVALWFRYTFLSPSVGTPSASVWAIFNSKKAGDNLALKNTFAMSEVAYHKTKFGLNLGGSILRNDHASGIVRDNANVISWNIGWRPLDSSIRQYPSLLYITPWPATKVVTPNPAVIASGFFEVNGIRYEVESSPLYQGHTWGRCYSNGWAWANCQNFAEDKSAILELVAQPSFGLGYLKIGQKKMRLFLRGRYNRTSWEFNGRAFGKKIEGRISTFSQNIIGITYHNPCGGKRYCYNTNIADVAVKLYEKKKGKWNLAHELTSAGTASFETVTSRPYQDL